jgi:hypothetical protein
MRKLSEGELLSLTGLLSMERDALAVSRVMKSLITDEDLKREAGASVLAAEGRIKGVQQFINENQVTNTGGAR